ncbi:MAG: flagellar export chaperone FliS [Acidobacteria bacterium]|nr:MAG: flagellar export chaperone FliS [Acidobacteriota bacterium]
MYAATYTANQYRNNSVNTSPEQLVVMCYDGMIRFLTTAETAIKEGDLQNKMKYVNKVLAIVEELQATLDFERGGEIARNLDRLYNFFSSQLMKVSLHEDLEVLEQLKNMFTELRASWAKVASEMATQGNASGNLALSG